MGIKKAEIPTIVRERNSRNLRDIQEFIESGWESAEVDLDGRKASVANIALRTIVSRNNIEGVKVMKRGEHVYLKRVK